MNLPLIILYVLQAILAATLFVTRRATLKREEREEEIRRQQWEMQTFGHRVDNEGSGRFSRRTGTMMMGNGSGMGFEKETRVGVGLAEIRKRSRSRGVNF